MTELSLTLQDIQGEALRQKATGTYHVDANYVKAIWPLVEPFIEKALEHDLDADFVPSDILNFIALGNQQLWIVYREGLLVGAITTECQLRMRKKVCLIHLASGKGLHDSAQAAFDTIEGWARQIGCTALQIYGRPGFLKALPRYGFRHAYTIMSKPIGLNLH